MTAAQARPIKSSTTFDAEFQRTYTSIYEVITDDVQDGPVTAIQAAGIPIYRQSYQWGNDFDDWAFADGITAEIRDEKETRKLWTVTVHFSTRPMMRCGDTRIENPLDEPIRISGSFAGGRKPAEQTWNGTPIINSSDEPFVPAIEIDDSRDTLRIQMNTPTINLGLRAQFKDAVNSGTIWGLGARTVKMTQWAYDILYWGTCNQFVGNAFEFHIDYGTWDAQPLDAGFREKINPAATDPVDIYRTIADVNDNQRHQPTPLNGAGRIADIAGGDPPFYHRFRIYNEMDFSALGIPDPLPGPFA